MKGWRVHRFVPFVGFGARNSFQSLCVLGCVLFGLLFLLLHLSGDRPSTLSPVLTDHLTHSPPPSVPPAQRLVTPVTTRVTGNGHDVTFTSRPGLQSCARKKHIVFLKVHKTGSTTVANILQRFALRENLNVLLPNRLPGSIGFNTLSRSPSLPPNSFIPAPPGQTHHVVCNHMVYNRTALDQLLPKDTVYVTVAREPESRFVSAMTYYGILHHVSRDLPDATTNLFSHYLAHLELYGEPPEIYNTLAFNLGVPRDQYHNVSFLEELARRLDGEFNLLMLTERLDEGLLMLKRLMCWELRDIVYIMRNQGWTTPHYAMTRQDRKRFRKWQEADFFLYRYFQRRFHNLLAAQGEEFFQELSLFREIQRRVWDFCIDDLPLFHEPLVVPASPFNAQFTVTDDDCFLLLSDELTLVERLMDRAWFKYHQAGGTLRSFENHVSEKDFRDRYGVQPEEPSQGGEVPAPFFVEEDPSFR